MSEIQKGRPTIYGEGQPPRRRANRSGMYSAGAESQQKHAAGTRRKTVHQEPGARSDSQARRMTDRLDGTQMEHTDRPVTENRVRTEQAPRRYVPGAGYQGAVPSDRGREIYAANAPDRRNEARGSFYTGDVPRRRVDVPTPAAYAAPAGRSACDREELQEEMRRTDFASDRKLRALWSVFGILAVLLVAAIIYEVVLGNGLKETGNQRMAGQTGTQTTIQTNAQTTAQTNAAASTPATDAASTTQTTAQTSAAATPDAGTTDAAAGSDSAAADDSADSAADGSADDTVDDIPTIPLEGDDVQADAASGAEG